MVAIAIILGGISWFCFGMSVIVKIPLDDFDDTMSGNIALVFLTFLTMIFWPIYYVCRLADFLGKHLKIYLEKHESTN